MRRLAIPLLVVTAFGLGVGVGRSLFPVADGTPQASPSGRTTQRPAIPAHLAEPSGSGSGPRGPSTASAPPGTPLRPLDAAPVATVAELLALVDPQATLRSQTRLYASLVGLDVEALRRLADGLADVPASDPRLWPTRNALYEAWAEADPAGALAYVDDTAKGAGWSDQWIHNLLVSRWAEVDPAAADAYASGLERGPKRQACLAALATGWARRDPQAALDWAERIEPAASRHASLHAVLTQLALSDPERALAHAGSLPRGHLRQQLLFSVLPELASRDPDAALGWAAQLESPIERSHAVRVLAQSLFHDDPDEALALISSLPASQKRTGLLENIAIVAVRSDPASAPKWLDALPEAGLLRGGFLGGWAQSDPRAAAAYLDGRENDGVPSNAFSEVAAGLARTDPEAAVAWAAALGLKHRDEALRSAATTWASSEPTAALEYLLALERGIDDGNAPSPRDAIVNSVLSSWATTAPDEAIAWLRDQPLDAQTRLQGTVAVLGSTGHAHPASSAALFDELIGTQPAEDRQTFQHVAASIASAWSMHDPVEAAAWSARLPAGAERQNAIRSAVSTWAQYDLEAASSWVDRLGGVAREEALPPLVLQMAAEDPEAAFRWAMRTTDEEPRAWLLGQVVERWKYLDPTAAQEAAATANVSAAAREQLLRAAK